MWISITMTIVLELVPVDLRTSSIALYLFVITNIGGNAPLLVTPIQNAFHKYGLNNQDSLRGTSYTSKIIIKIQSSNKSKDLTHI